ncbi:MAG: sigma-70 family RNA polymerase sigma factor [Bacteroidota bacterium]
MKERSDEQILQQLRAADERENDKALKYLYAKCYPVIEAFISRNSGSTEDVADVFQDAIVIFYRKVKVEQLELHCAIQTYLFSVCKKLWLHRLRGRKKELIVDKDISFIAIEDDSLDIITRNENKELIASVLHQLGEGCQQILTYYYFERLRMKDIATRMGLQNEQVARNKKAGCMKKLRSLIEQSPRLKKLFT